jgi:RNA polymerase sigma factor (sigma-70 family)
MINTKLLLNNSPENWENHYLTTSAKLEPAVAAQIKLLNLEHCYLTHEVINHVYLSICCLIERGKLIYNSTNEIWFYVKDGSEESPEEIDNFKAWLRTVFFNHLQKLRDKQNQQNRVINIDNCWDVSGNDNPLNHIFKTELRDKLYKFLSNEEIRIIEMHYFQGLKFKEIASLLESEGFPKYKEDNLRQKQRRAIEKLRATY